MDNYNEVPVSSISQLIYWKLLLFLTVILLLYYYYTNTFDFFKKRNIKYMKPTIIFGILWDRFLNKNTFYDLQLNIYNTFKGKGYGGVFFGKIPVLYVVDPELIKAVLITDSNHFADKAPFPTKEPDWITQSLFFLGGPKWKAVRNLLSPFATTGRLKNMYPLIKDCIDHTIFKIDEKGNSEIDMKDEMLQLTLNVIGVCAFGISINNLKGDNTRFKQLSIEAVRQTTSQKFLTMMTFLFAPKLAKLMPLSIFNLKAYTELRNILRKVRSNRTSSETRRNDFLQLLIDGTTKSEENRINSNVIKYLNEDTIDAQSLVFLIAGFETNSSMLSFFVFEMSLHPDVQEKLRDHIEKVTKGEELSYDHLVQLDYLDAVIKEVLRLYPSLPRLDRVCTTPYTLPGTSVRIDVGDIVCVATNGIHMDPDIYPDPQSFKPERFVHQENKVAQLYLPFGAGPRKCIGGRFAMVVIKATIVSLLRKFKFSICSKTEIPILFSKNALLTMPLNGVWLRVDKI